jgi:hypothetical protein
MLLTLAPDRLFSLSHPYEVDGRVSWHSPTVHGFAPMNSYLLREGDHALLIETGLTVNQDAILDELEACLSPGSDLAVLVLRLGEFDSVCNLLPIVHTFGVSTVYGQYDYPLDWADFRTDCRLSSNGTITFRGVDRRFPDLETRALGRFEVVPIGFGARKVDVLRPEFRLLNTHWVYDELTRTLFTSDVFSHVVSSGPDGPWVVTSENDFITREEVREHLLTTRYWWLPDAYVDELRTSVSDVFERYTIETIAPSFGCILHGADVVQRHFTMLDRIIAETGRSRVATAAKARS